MLLVHGADLAILNSRTHHLPAALQLARTQKCYVPLLERSCFPLPGRVQLQCSFEDLTCNQSSSTAFRHVKGDQLCHLLLRHMVEVPLRLLSMPAGVRAGAPLSHKLLVGKC